MAASGNMGAQTVMAFDIGLGLAMPGQCLLCVQRLPTDHLAIDQQVQDIGLGRHAFGLGKFNGGEHGLFIVVQHQGKNMRHRTRRSSPRGTPWLFGKNSRSRAICWSVSKKGLLIITPANSRA